MGHRIFIVSAMLVLLSTADAATSQFVVFPKAESLASPDGRFVVRSVDADNSAAEFTGKFRSLWLFETATGRSRKLFDYLGVAAVAWSGSERIIVTEYPAKRTARTLIFSVSTRDGFLLDKVGLTQLAAVELRPSLRENDHVFVEGSRVEQDTLYLRVWGYGTHDPNGFRWRCEYSLSAGTVACFEDHGGR